MMKSRSASLSGLPRISSAPFATATAKSSRSRDAVTRTIAPPNPHARARVTSSVPRMSGMSRSVKRNAGFAEGRASRSLAGSSKQTASMPRLARCRSRRTAMSRSSSMINAISAAPGAVLPHPRPAVGAHSFDTGYVLFSAVAYYCSFWRGKRKACAPNRAKRRGRSNAFTQS